jgi:hypothetical protein
MKGRLSPALVAAVVVVAALVVAAFGAVGYAAPDQTAAQAQYAPQNTALPAITGTAATGQTLTATTGTFSGDQPITYAFQWQRCDTAGAACVPIGGATAQTYVPATPDVGRTIRVVVTATNTLGSANATSAPTAVVRVGLPPGAIRLPSGLISIPVTSVTDLQRLVIRRVAFSPIPVRSRQTTITVRARVFDTRGFVVRGALVFVRSTPLVTTAMPERPTAQDGWVVFQTRPRSTFPLRNGYSVQFFARARKAGDDVLAGVSSRRLVQLRTASPS